MKKYFEHLLLSVLIGITIVLGLTFWLNIKYGFNLLSNQHWQELASLQASGAQIDKDFYVSIGAAILIFIICLNIIYHPHLRKSPKPVKKDNPKVPTLPAKTEPTLIESDKKSDKKQVPNEFVAKNDRQMPPQKQTTPESNIALTRPPKLVLPKNMAQIMAAQHAQQPQQIPETPRQTDKYDNELATIFSNNSFMVKKKTAISGFTPNLFAIGANEIVWIGGVDCDIEKLNKAIQRLDLTFKETLQDITITINAFIVDTNGKYNSESKIHIFHNIDELKQYISQNPGAKITDSDREDFDAYSNYIDTVLTLLYKM